jgi:hypothetical protein
MMEIKFEKQISKDDLSSSIDKELGPLVQPI